MSNIHENQGAVVSVNEGIERNTSVDKSGLDGGRDLKEGSERLGSREVGELVEVDAAIPKGTIDPVYEAKARVLNAAVCFPSPI